jgi:hypothetical protein
MAQTAESQTMQTTHSVHKSGVVMLNDPDRLAKCRPVVSINGKHKRGAISVPIMIFAAVARVAGESVESATKRLA